MAFERKYLSNASATGMSGNVFVYGNVDAAGTAADATAAIVGDGFFDEAKDVLAKGNIIIVSDGATTSTVTVTTAKGVTPIVVA